MFIFTINQDLWARELMDRMMSCDHSLGRNVHSYDIHFKFHFSFFMRDEMDKTRSHLHMF
jgi:hypothetical protein